MRVSKYHSSPVKRIYDVTFSAVVLTLSLPVMLLIIALCYLFAGRPVFFLQNRAGKNGEVFKIIKFRTMIVGAEKLRSKYKKMNESDGPVFKIVNDPRFTPFGKLLSKTGLNELPQFINVLKGDMSVIGPRPLPVYEDKKLPRKYKIRTLVNPGISSPWVVNGSHRLTFKEWMNLDLGYIKNGNLGEDLGITLATFILIVGFLVKSFRFWKNY